jgi:hypothetical protein
MLSHKFLAATWEDFKIMSMLFLRRFVLVFCETGCVSLVSVAAEPIDIGTRRDTESIPSSVDSVRSCSTTPTSPHVLETSK